MRRARRSDRSDASYQGQTEKVVSTNAAAGSPPLLIVLFLTRHQAGDSHLPHRSARGDAYVPPRVAVVRDGQIHPIELPAEREGAARLLGALALPAWAHDEKFAPPPEHMDLKRRAKDVHRSMDMSSATESRARQQDLGPALEAAGLRPSDYLDIDLKGNRNALRELRNACDDVSLLLDADDPDDVRWILDTARLGGDGEPDIAMGWLWDPAAREEVLARFRKLEARTARPGTAAVSGWQLAAPKRAVVARGQSAATREDVKQDASARPTPKPPRRLRGYLVGAALGLGLPAMALLGVRSWSDDPAPRPPGVVLRVDNRTTSGRYVREDEDRLPLTSRPVPHCRSRGCELKDSPIWETGQRIDRAVCQQQGERITNGDDGSPVDDDNPLLDQTTRYYAVVLKDGRRGYVAEIWIARKQRGGLGLPSCSRVLPDLPRR